MDLLLRAHHHIQQVVEKEVGGRQGVHPGLGDGHLLVACRAPQLQRVPGTALALKAVPAEGVEAGQDVEPPGGLAGGGRGMWGRWGCRRARGDRSRGAAQLLAERARLQVRVRKWSHLQRYRNTGSVHKVRCDEADVLIWGHIGPLCHLENNVELEVDSVGVEVSSTVKRVLVSLNISSLYCINLTWCKTRR